MRIKRVITYMTIVLALMTLVSCNDNPRYYIVEADDTYPIYCGYYTLRDERWDQNIKRSFIVHGNDTEKLKTYGLPLIDIHAWDYTDYIQGVEADSHITLRIQ